MEMGKLVLGVEINSKGFDNQIKETQEKVNTLNKRLEETKNMKPYAGQEEDIKNYQIEIEKATNKLVQLQKQQQKISLSKVKNIEFNPLKSGNYSLQTGQPGKTMKGFNADQLKYTATNFEDFKSGIDDVDNKTNNFTNKSKSKFESFGKTIKKVGLRILGLSSIFAIVSRASSTYLSQDTELAQKLQNVWVGLGSFLAPVLELMANVMAKAIGYLNVFIHALTGTDYIAKANAKALEKQTKAQVGLNKAVERYSYDFDVIRKQDSQNDDGGGISGGGVDTSGFDMPELNEKVVEKLQKLAKWLKENKDLIVEVGKVLGITFGALAIANLLKNIGSLIGIGGAGGSGLAGLAWLLGIIAAVWLCKIIVDGVAEAIKQAKELNKELDDNLTMQADLSNKSRELSKSFYELALKEEGSGKATQKTTDYYYKQAKAIESNIVRLQENKNWVGALTGANDKLHSEQLILLGSMQDLINRYTGLYMKGKLTEDQTKEFQEVLQEARKMMILLGQSTKDVDKVIEEVSKKDHTIKVNTEVQDNVTYCINDIINRNNNKSIRLNAEFYDPKKPYSSYYGYAAGGIVTQPTRALIGEAGYPEAVVPMTQDYLATLAGAIAQAGGTGSSGVVNVYLDGRLIQKQVDSRQKQANFARNM